MNNLTDLLLKTANEYNIYSQLVALCRAYKEEGKCTEEDLQWKRGYRSCCENQLKEVAAIAGATLIWECSENVVATCDQQRTLEYRTVRVQFPGNEGR